MSASPTQNTFNPGPSERTVRDAQGQVLDVPAGWALLPPGDAALTRRVKKATEHWVIQEKRGRRTFSQGVWASAIVIAQERGKLLAERDDPAYQKKLEAGRARRAKAQANYVVEFRDAVLDFLDFDPQYARLAGAMADAVSSHATPVGSGTVARTKRIPVEKRAQAAVIAWMRHQTTAYDSLRIPRVKGKRREVRRMLARESRKLLDAYRRGLPVEASACPLQRALSA